MLVGCDVAEPDPPSAIGPPVHLVGVFPTDGCGSGPEDCSVPTNVGLTLRFDRFLNPVTAIRQSIQVYPGDPRVGVPFTFDVDYDPIERVVEYRVPPGAGYRPNTLYQAELFVAKARNDPGIRAFDGAPLAPGDLPLKFSFFTGDGPVELPTPPAPPSCDDIVGQAFGKLGSCAGSECHRKGDNVSLTDGSDLGAAPHQLWLDSTDHFALSAIGRVAHQTDLGDTSGGSSTPKGERFGVRMSLVEPGNPGAS
ncbi:MAG TPA: hypothetical protein VER04_01910, partial [Polyangiaceae bacterium]|nr:hypothetical protein [Polyangiaceae bacterium]